MLPDNSLQFSQRDLLDLMAPALLQDEIGALARRQDVVVQVHEVDPIQIEEAVAAASSSDNGA